MTLGEVLNNRRKEIGMEVDELVSKCGVPKSSLTKVLTGVTKNPSFDSVIAIASAMGLTANDVDRRMDGNAEIVSAKSHTIPLLGEIHAGDPMPASDDMKRLKLLDHESIDIASSFARLDKYGKAAVKAVLLVEEERVKAEANI